MVVDMKTTQCMWWLSHSVVSDSCDPMDCSPPGSSVHGHSPGKNIEAGCHFLLQGIFLTQELNPGICIAGRSLPTKLQGKPPHRNLKLKRFCTEVFILLPKSNLLPPFCSLMKQLSCLSLKPGASVIHTGLPPSSPSIGSFSPKAASVENAPASDLD